MRPGCTYITRGRSDEFAKIIEPSFLAYQQHHSGMAARGELKGKYFHTMKDRCLDYCREELTGKLSHLFTKALSKLHSIR